MLLPNDRVTLESKLQLGAMSGSLALLKLGSVLMSKVSVTIKDHGNAQELRSS